MFNEQTFNAQEAATVLLYILGSTGDTRHRAEQKFSRYAGDHVGMSQGAALYYVQAYGGLNDHGGLNERGTANALTILSRAGSSLAVW